MTKDGVCNMIARTARRPVGHDPSLSSDTVAALVAHWIDRGLLPFYDPPA
jgi:hypothetical protein